MHVAIVVGQGHRLIEHPSMARVQRGMWNGNLSIYALAYKPYFFIFHVLIRHGYSKIL